MFLRLSIFACVLISCLAQAAPVPKSLSEAQKAMRLCTDITHDSDPRERRISNQVQLELGDTCVVQKHSESSISLLNNQINSAFKMMNVDSVWSDVNKIALNRSVKAVWATYMNLIKDEKLNRSSALHLIQKHFPKLFTKPESKKEIETAWSEYSQQLLKKPVKYLSGLEQNQILQKEIQPIIAGMNEICQEARKRNVEIFTAHSCTKFYLDKKNPQPTSRCEALQQQAIKKRWELRELTEQNIQLSMQRLTASELAPLFITDSLREKMGQLKAGSIEEKCLKGSGQLFNQVWNADLIKARNEFYGLTLREVKSIREDFDEKTKSEKDKTIKQYLKTNPSTVAEFLRRKPTKQNALALCKLVQDIQSSDSWNIVGDRILMGAGVVSSVALMCTGVGSAAGAAALTAVLAVGTGTIVKGHFDYETLVDEKGKIKASFATQQKQLQEALRDFKVIDERILQIQDNSKMAKIEMVMSAGTAGLWGGVKLLQSLKTARNIASTLKVAEEAALIKSLEKTNKFFRNQVKALGPDGLHLAKLSLDEEAKLTNLLQKMPQKEIQAFVPKLAQLKRPEEIAAFIKQMEEAQSLLIKAKYDPKLLAKLVDRSKKFPPVAVKIERSPSTSKLLVRLTKDEQQILFDSAKKLKVSKKMKDAQVLEEIGKIQKDCLFKGMVRKGCFQLAIDKLLPPATEIVEAKAKAPMLERFKIYVKSAPGKAKEKTLTYVKQVKDSNGLRILVKPRVQGQSKNIFKNPGGYLNNPLATIRNSSWEVSAPVSMVGYTLIVDMPMDALKKNQVKDGIKTIYEKQGDLVGDDYLFQLLLAGIIDQEKLVEMYSEHGKNINSWLDEGEKLPRLEETAKILKLSPEQKMEVDQLAKKLYLAEIDLFLAKGVTRTQEEKLEFHLSLREKLSVELAKASSLLKLGAEERFLLSYILNPTLEIEGVSDVALTQEILTRPDSASRQILSMLIETEELDFGSAILMMVERKKFPEVITEKKKAAESLPADIRFVAERPDFSQVESIEMTTHPHGDKTTLKDEISRWNLGLKDPRFQVVLEQFKSGEINQLQYVERIDSSIQGYNEIYKVIEEKTLTPSVVNKTLENILFTKVKMDLEKWRSDYPRDPSWEKRKSQAVSIWLKYLGEESLKKSPDANLYDKEYQKVLQKP